MSRRHCEIVVVDGVMHLRDLDSHNAVLVNGRPVNTCRLELGDEVRIGRSVFFITKGGSKHPSSPSALEQHSTVTLAEHESTFFAPSHEDDETGEDRQDLRTLLDLSVVLSRAGSVRELTLALGQAVDARFQPDAAWLLLLHGKDKQFLCLRGPTEAHPPRDLMVMSLEGRKGALPPQCAGPVAGRV